MPIPDMSGWELPAIAIISITVIGWLLWTGREERQRVAGEMASERTRVAIEQAEERKRVALEQAEERKRYTEFNETLIQQADQDRREFMKSYRELAAQSIKAHLTVSKAVEDHDKRAAQAAEEHSRQSLEMWRAVQQEHQQIISSLQVPMR